MQRYASTCRILAWIALVIVVFFQTIAITATFHYQHTTVGDPIVFGVLLLVASALLVLSSIACLVLPRGKIVAFWAAIAGAVFCIVLGCFMPVVFKYMRDDVDATTTGISVLRAIFCHIAPPALTALFLLPTWSVYRENRINEQYAAEMERTPSYFDTLGELDAMHLPDDHAARQPKPKRSVRDRQRKENDQ